MKNSTDISKENFLYQAELLSYLINDKSIYFKSIDHIRPDMFTGTYRRIFDSFIAMIKDNQEPDVLSLSERSTVPMDQVIKISNYFSGSPVPIEVLINELFDHMAKERLVKLAGFISSQATAGTDHEEIISQINTVIADLQIGNTTSVITMPVAVGELVNRINNNRKTERRFSGTPVGMKLFDVFMGGLHPGDLIILAGETSHGKTSLALSMMFNTAVMFNQPVGIISHEMTPEQLTGRLSAYATKISSKSLLFERLSDDDFQRFNKSIQVLINSNILIQDFIKRELSETLAAIRIMKMQHDIRYIVVENAGNINVKGKFDDESRTAEISKSMKSIAMELNITVILISHLSRERDGKKVQPTLNRLRHSGQLENDADVVLFIYSAEIHNKDFFDDDTDTEQVAAKGRVKVYIAKGRNVGMAQRYMYYAKELTYVSDVETRDEIPF